MAILIDQTNSVGAGSAAEPSARERPSGEVLDWRQELKVSVRTASQLLEAIELPADFRSGISGPETDFPVFAPWPYIRRMKKGDPRDPLLLQVLPRPEEARLEPGFSADAVGDLAAERAPGLIHKYQGRALLITTGACAVHCRYCFRRHFPYETAPRSLADWQPAIDVLRADATIEEVILSGGDPWTLVDDTLAALANELATIPHLKRLRIHTRLPIVIPQRVTDELIAATTGTRLTPIVVVHANHAREIDAAVEASLLKLARAGCVMLNQAVLLRGVNDSVEALADLSRRLLDCRVTPYYLHQLDRVQGAAHFEVPLERGQVLVDKLRPLLPGYLVPRYVREIAGETHKRVL